MNQYNNFVVLAISFLLLGLAQTSKTDNIILSEIIILVFILILFYWRYFSLSTYDETVDIYGRILYCEQRLKIPFEISLAKRLIKKVRSEYLSEDNNNIFYDLLKKCLNGKELAYPNNEKKWYVLQEKCSSRKWLINPDDEKILYDLLKECTSRKWLVDPDHEKLNCTAIIASYSLFFYGIYLIFTKFCYIQTFNCCNVFSLEGIISLIILIFSCYKTLHLHYDIYKRNIQKRSSDFGNIAAVD
jgi:hypothetical protein